MAADRERDSVNDTASKRVLVTGSSGHVGRHICSALKSAGHHVIGFDRAPMPDGVDVDQMHIGLVSDAATLRQLAKEADVLIHLAATPDDADFMTQLLPNNIVGLYNVCEAARLAKVSRLVLTSTCQLILPLDWKQRVITLDDRPEANNHYALAKLYAEEMGHMYARTHGLAVLSMRLGWLPREPIHARQINELEPNQSLYLSGHDAGEAYRCAVEAKRPAAGESIVIMVGSKPKRAIGMDLSPAKDVIGFEPRHTYPQGMPEHLLESK